MTASKAGKGALTHAAAAALSALALWLGQKAVGTAGAQSLPAPAGVATAAQVSALQAEVQELRAEVKGYLVRVATLELKQARAEGAAEAREAVWRAREHGR